MLKYISHEYIEASTDPRLNSWVDKLGHEIGDKCNSYSPVAEEETDPNAFAPTLGGEALEATLFNQSINADHYYVQSEWDNGANACTMRPVPLEGTGFTPSSATALVGSPASFSAAAVDRYGGLGFSWTFGDGGSGSGSAPSHVYAAPGVYTVTMTARDSLTGSTAPAVEHTIVVNDVPSASFAASPNPGTPGVAMEFNASASRDPDGAIVGYAWTFGDGAAASGASVSHAYAAGGTYTITLTVTDSAGQTAAVAHSLNVSPAGALANSAQTLTGSKFNSLSATVDPSTGAITFTEFPANAGRFSWLLTFQNGRFGVYASRNAKCKPGFLGLGGRCRPARIVFAKGGQSVASAGAVSFTIRPTAAGLRALRVALKRHTGLALLAALTFQSSVGGAPVTHTQSLTVRPKRK
jgi:PKD repeat protein